MFEVDKIQYLQIGVQGENVATDIEIDMSAWVEKYPDAQFHILFKPYNASAPSPMTTSYSDGVLTWTVGVGATAVVGVGYTEIRAQDAQTGLIKKTRIIPTAVENSVSGVSADPPASYQEWVTSVLNAGSDSEAYARGTRSGSDVGDSDPAYHNNSLYYKGLAEDAKDAAETAQELAEAARDAAQAAAGDFQGMTATASGLDADDDPTVEVTHSQGGFYNMEFGIPQGTTFTPAVAANGDISWTNDGGKTNPTTMNIKGPQGDPAPAEQVTPAVDAYLAEHFTNPSNPPLDRSLLSSSSAAPADMVGDLKSALNTSEHLLNNETLQVTKSVPGTSGTSIRTFDSVLLLGGHEYVFKSEGSSLSAVCSSVIYDINSTQLKVIGDINGSGSKQVTYTPSDDVMIKVGHYCYATSGSITDTIYMSESVVKKNDTIGNTEVLSLLGEMPVDFFAKYDGYVDSTGGITSGSSYRSTEYVDVSKFSHIAYKRIGITGSSAGTGMAFYDANKTKVAFVVSMASQSANGYLSSYNYVQVPENAVYARFTTYIDISTYGNFALFGIPKVKYINILKSYLEKGAVTLSQDDFVVNQWSTRGMEPNANRLSNKILIPVAKGDRIIFSTNALYVFMGIYDYGMTSRTTIQDFTLANDGKVIFVNMDGLLNITLKNSSGSAISVTDYDATIKIQNRYFIGSSKKSHQYDYYGEKIQLNGFDAKEVLTLNMDNGAPNDIAVYGDYLLMGTNRSPNDGKLVIFDMSDGTQKAVLSVTESNHFNSMAFSNTKYSNSDLFPLLYAETEEQNGLYLVIRISALDSYEIVKKYRFPESIYGTAPQIYWDFDHNTAYGICLKPTGREAKYNFFKFDCSDETQNEDGTYTPSVVFQSEIENPGVRQGGQYYKNRIYLMTTTTSYDHPTVIVVNCDCIYPAIVSKLPNLPFSGEGEGLTISTDAYGEQHFYISDSYKVYELEF